MGNRFLLSLRDIWFRKQKRECWFSRSNLKRVVEKVESVFLVLRFVNREINEKRVGTFADPFRVLLFENRELILDVG